MICGLNFLHLRNHGSWRRSSNWDKREQYEIEMSENRVPWGWDSKNQSPNDRHQCEARIQKLHRASDPRHLRLNTHRQFYPMMMTMTQVWTFYLLPYALSTYTKSLSTFSARCAVASIDVIRKVGQRTGLIGDGQADFNFCTSGPFFLFQKNEWLSLLALRNKCL